MASPRFARLALNPLCRGFFVIASYLGGSPARSSQVQRCSPLRALPRFAPGRFACPVTPLVLRWSGFVRRLLAARFAPRRAAVVWRACGSAGSAPASRWRPAALLRRALPGRPGLRPHAARLNPPPRVASLRTSGPASLARPTLIQSVNTIPEYMMYIRFLNASRCIYCVVLAPRSEGLASLRARALPL